MDDARRKRQAVAVIGSGVAGLTAAYLLQRSYDVTLYERDQRLGGHAHTHDVVGPEGGLIPVDSGFIVHNDRTYPLLTRLFAELGVESQDTEMSMSISCRGCGLEYAGAKGTRGLFARPSSLVNVRFLHMLTEVTAFHRRARRLLDRSPPYADAAESMTLGAFLAGARLSRYLATHFVLPLVAAVWSSGSGDALRYPARYLFQFLDHHGMLTVHGSPTWRTVVGGSRTYVERAAKHLTAVRTSLPVRTVRRFTDRVEVHTDDDGTTSFDHVVIATHADDALSLLTEPTPAERQILGTFTHSVNETVLHTDASVLPRTRAAHASWNYVLDECSGLGTPRPRGASMTYDMNRLHRLGPETGGTHYLVSLGSSANIRPDSLIERMWYQHPIHTTESVAALGRLNELSAGRTRYAGAWQGWGFHEDGCASGVRAAATLGVSW